MKVGIQWAADADSKVGTLSIYLHFCYLKVSVVTLNTFLENALEEID